MVKSEVSETFVTWLYNIQFKFFLIISFFQVAAGCVQHIPKYLEGNMSLCKGKSLKEWIGRLEETIVLYL